MTASRRSNRRCTYSRDGFRQIATAVGLGTALVRGLTDNGYVDCAKASEQSGINSPKQWSAARANAISMGFRDR